MTNMQGRLEFFDGLWERLNASLNILILRNYEELPHSLGNDIDILISQSDIKRAIEICEEFSINSDFKIHHIEQPNHVLSSILFVSKSENNLSKPLKIDFFTQMTKGWIIYADTRYILENKTDFKSYKVPNLNHEAYLLLMKELFMYKRVRERYFSKFNNKYKNIDLDEFDKVSSNYISKKTILKIKPFLKTIDLLSLMPTPKLNSFFRPLRFFSWLYYSMRYRFSNLCKSDEKK